MKHDNIAIIIGVIITIILAVVSFAIEARLNHIRYGDWTCMYKNCVIVKDKE